jgi:hypothetical protein
MSQLFKYISLFHKFHLGAAAARFKPTNLGSTVHCSTNCAAAAVQNQYHVRYLSTLLYKWLQ